MNTDTALPLTTETGIRAALERQSAEVFKKAEGKSLDHLDTQVSFALERFEKAIVGRALWRLVPSVRAVHARCAAEGRTSRAEGVDLGNGTRAFLVPTESKTVILLAVERGESRFVTGIHAESDDKGDRIDVLVGRWAPDAAEFLAGLPDPLPEDATAVVKLAGKAAKYAEIGSGLSLEEIGRYVAEGPTDRLPYESDMTGGRFFSLKDMNVPLMHYSANPIPLGGWVEYTQAMAPVAALAPETSDFKLFYMNGRDEVAAAALALDGGFFGPTSAALTYAHRGFMLVNHLRAAVGTFRQNHDDLVQLGAIWGKKSFVHGDSDMCSFAVPLQDPNKRAFVHHSIHSDGPSARYLVLLTLGAGDAVTGVEVHPLYKPAESERENWGSRVTVDDLMRLADRANHVSDPEAASPRLSQAELIRRLQAGEPLPPPALAADLVTGAVPVLTRVGEAIGFYWMTDLIGATRKALDQALSVDKKGRSSLEFRREFGDEEYGEHAPGAAPRRKR